MEVPPGLVLWKEQRRAPEEKCLLTFKSPLVEWKLTCCKMEICPGPREPALGITLFILQTESLKRKKQSQGRSCSSGAPGRAVPRMSVWVFWSCAIWKIRKGKIKWGTGRGEEKAGKAEKRQRREEGAVWESLRGPCRDSQPCRQGNTALVFCCSWLGAGDSEMCRERFTLSHAMSQRQEAEIDLMTRCSLSQTSWRIFNQDS